MGCVPPRLANPFPPLLLPQGEALAAARGLLCAMALSAGFWLVLAMTLRGMRG